MDHQPKSHEKISQLISRGVNIPSPASLDIGEDVNIEQIAAEDVTIYPGCRIYGKKTAISSGCKLGYEAPATVVDCQLGEAVELKGGFFSKSVFLDKANMGMGAHVREGCILEEEAGGAHCVGLKQTILFPFVTLGSLINFCDCLMAGGTSRSNHSEVGSSYIHFNFTPDADKTTPSLIGDVPRGVMLNQPPIFLGGQGGIVGPIRMGYGNVVAAGSILKENCLRDNQLIFAVGPSRSIRITRPSPYSDISGVVENNIFYLANLVALESWYAHVRKPFMEARQFGNLLYAGALEQISSAKKERLKRLKAMAQKASALASKEQNDPSERGKKELNDQMDYVTEVFSGPMPDISSINKMRENFLDGFDKAAGKSRANYLETIQNLSTEISSKGVAWLNSVVEDLCAKVAKVAPSLNLFDK
jgi:UDP-N-acetylglucosamine/UDP-N-acetylgalactosamine diphosphorylase